MNVLSLFSGIGGLDLAVKDVWSGAKTVCYVEIEKYCQQILLRRMEDGSIEQAPIFTDIFNLRGYGFAEGSIDLIVGGFPCQPFSVAGKRKGEADERHLWPEIVRLARELGCPTLLLENVPGLLSIDDGRAFGRILGDLATLGYLVRWGVVGACEAGAPHRRERVFILADTNKAGRGE